jgi:hypothetical protein
MMPSFDTFSGIILPPMSPVVCSFVNFHRTMVLPIDDCIGPAPANIQQYMSASVVSAKFAGFIQPLFSETYTLSLSSPDSVVIFIDGLKIVNKVSNATASRMQFEGTIALQAMALYPILVEYIRDGGHNVSIVLSWKSSSQVLEIISSSRM